MNGTVITMAIVLLSSAVVLCEVTNYGFSYDVRDVANGDVKSHQEVRRGDLVTGSYRVLQPDGTFRIVEYTVDGPDGGFKAVVRKQPRQDFHAETAPQGLQHPDEESEEHEQETDQETEPSNVHQPSVGAPATSSFRFTSKGVNFHTRTQHPPSSYKRNQHNVV